MAIKRVENSFHALRGMQLRDAPRHKPDKNDRFLIFRTQSVRIWHSTRSVERVFYSFTVFVKKMSGTETEHINIDAFSKKNGIFFSHNGD